jgi:hypothetical protein
MGVWGGVSRECVYRVCVQGCVYGGAGCMCRLYEGCECLRICSGFLLLTITSLLVLAPGPIWKALGTGRLPSPCSGPHVSSQLPLGCVL